MGDNSVRTALTTLMLCSVMVIPLRSGVAQHVASSRAEVPTTQRVTIDTDRAPLLAVLQSIAQQAGLSAAYNKAVIPSGTLVTLHMRNVAVAEAFDAALRGTGLIATVQPRG